jgi:hypothetical protein
VTESEQLLTVIRNSLLYGMSEKTLKDICDEAITEACQIKEERKKRQEEAKREHERVIAERMKPENAIPRMFPFIHVQENRQDLLDYCMTYDHSALEQYANDLASGLHKDEFRGKSSIEVLAFLREQINARKTKDETDAHEILFQGIKTVAKAVNTTENKVQNIEQKLNPSASSKAKSYTA